MAGPYQTSPNRTLVRKYRADRLTPERAYTGGTPGRCRRRAAALIRRHITALRLALAAADGLTAMALFIGLSIVRFGSPGWRDVWAFVGIDPFVAAAGYGLALVTALWLQGLYRLRTRLSIRREVIDVLVAILLLAVVVFTTLYLLKLPNVSRLFLLLLFSCQAVLTLVSRAVDPGPLRPAAGARLQRPLHARRRRQPGGRGVRRRGRGPRRAGAAADRLPGRPARPGVGPGLGLPRPVLGTVDEIQDILHGTVVDEVAICLGLEDWSLVEPITRLCEDEGGWSASPSPRRR